MWNQILASLPAHIVPYLWPLSIISLSLVTGIFLELMASSLIRRAMKGAEKNIHLLFRLAVRKKLFLLMLCIGLSGAISVTTTLDPAIRSIAEKGLMLITILAVTLIVSGLATAFVQLYGGKIRGIFASTSIFANIIKVLIIAIGVLIALQSIGISIAPFLAALGVGGLAIALALQDTLSNLFSGLQILASKQVKPGDFVELENGKQGYVDDITWRNTTIRSLARSHIIVPNSKMASSIISNFSKTGEELSVSVDLIVGYENDLVAVEKMAIEVAKEVMARVPGGVPNYEPKVRFSLFTDNNIRFSVSMRGKEIPDQFALRHEFLKAIHTRFREEGIVITPAARPVASVPGSKI